MKPFEFTRVVPVSVMAVFAASPAFVACSKDSAVSSTGPLADGGDLGNGGTSSGTGGATGSSGGAASGGAHAASGGAGTGSGGSSSSGGASPGSGGTSSTGGTGGTSSAGGTTGSGGTTTALVNPAPGSKFFVGANFWNIDWEGKGDFFTDGVDFATTDNPWRPELLADLAPYHVLRFMDWNLTNNSNNPQASWDTRKKKTEDQNEPVAFEWQIDLSNRAHTDYWLNVPHETAPDYWPKLATLVKDSLDPSLRVYLEWSNEVWNGGFPAHDYAANHANTLGLSGSDKAAAYYVYQSVRLYEAFETVFGKDSPRLVKVLAGQAAWTGPCDAHRTALSDTTINPNGTKPTVYAVAPYFGGTSISALQTDLDQVNQWVAADKTCADAATLPLVSYEGGQDSFAAGSGCTTLQHDPGMHDLYGSYFDGLVTNGLTGPFMQYTHTGSCWGLKEKTGDSDQNSPKYKGVKDWLAAHP